MFWGTYTCGGKRPLSGARNFAPMNLEKNKCKGLYSFITKISDTQAEQDITKNQFVCCRAYKKNNDKSEQDIRWLSESLEWMSIKIEP